MLHLRKALRSAAAHLAGRRARIRQQRILVYQLLEFPIKSVIFNILYLRGILLVIQLIVAADLLAKLRDSFPRLHIAPSRPGLYSRNSSNTLLA